MPNLKFSAVKCPVSATTSERPRAANLRTAMAPEYEHIHIITPVFTNGGKKLRTAAELDRKRIGRRFKRPYARKCHWWAPNWIPTQRLRHHLEMVMEHFLARARMAEHSSMPSAKGNAVRGDRQLEAETPSFAAFSHSFAVKNPKGKEVAVTFSFSRAAEGKHGKKNGNTNGSGSALLVFAEMKGAGTENAAGQGGNGKARASNPNQNSGWTDTPKVTDIFTGMMKVAATEIALSIPSPPTSVALQTAENDAPPQTSSSSPPSLPNLQAGSGTLVAVLMAVPQTGANNFNSPPPPDNYEMIFEGPAIAPQATRNNVLPFSVLSPQGGTQNSATEISENPGTSTGNTGNGNGAAGRENTEITVFFGKTKVNAPLMHEPLAPPES